MADVDAVGDTIYAAYGTAPDTGLWISTDGGDSFTRRTTANGLASNNLRRVVASGSKLYVATDRGLSMGECVGPTPTPTPPHADPDAHDYPDAKCLPDADAHADPDAHAYADQCVCTNLVGLPGLPPARGLRQPELGRRPGQRRDAGRLCSRQCRLCRRR